MSDTEGEPPPVLLPCTICSRTFRPEVLARHVKVCEKTASKKRRVFDSFKSRVSGTELEEFLGPAPLPGQAPRRPCKSPVKKRAPSKWKETHENLIATLRAARGVEPPPDTVMEASKPAGNERCPSCNRYFGPRAFDRHVEFCKEKTARIKLTPSKVSQAQERLEARTKYRAPLSIKPKLTTKEKYSPMLTRKESTESCSVSTTSAKTSPPIPALNRNLKTNKQNSNNFSRQSPIRTSERQRSVSPTKKSILSSSKSSVKSDTQAKPTNQPKIKENLKSPEDLRPKTGTKASTQEKIRSSNPKLSQLEAETYRHLKNMKQKTREKISFKTTALSDNESIGTVDSEMSENRDKQAHCKWSSAESVDKIKQKPSKQEKITIEKEKIILDLTNIERGQLKTKDEIKSGRKSKQQKPQINDLSVNDESFGIFVAACTVRPPSSSASKTSFKTIKESQKNCVINKSEEEKLSVKSERKQKPYSSKRAAAEDFDHHVENKPEESLSKFTTKDEITVKSEKISKIPKPKFDATVKKMEKIKIVETVPEVSLKASEILNDVFLESEKKIKKNSHKWQNITHISTEELMHLSEDLNLSVNDDNQELNDSVIWEIAAEEFLKSEEPNQSTSAFSIDSLNENINKKNLNPEIAFEKSPPDEDELIVLHVTDPAKLLENDADMKLSVSEPCFPYSTVQKLKKKTPELKKVDIIVFSAFPNAIQSKVNHRKRRKQKKIKKLTTPESSYLREKTFLANDIPKPKRRRMSNSKTHVLRLIECGDYHFETSSKEEVEERKKKFIEGLKNHKEKIRKWQITANSHIQFLEGFQKSIEDDLKELKILSEGKKIKRRTSLKEFKKEKLKQIKEKHENVRTCKKNSQVQFKNQKFEYFEISLTDECNLNEEISCFSKEKDECMDTVVAQSSLTKGQENKDQLKTKKFECFEIANDNIKLHKGREKNVQFKESVFANSIKNEEASSKNVMMNIGERLELTSTAPNSVCHQNSSLENIEEVDENVEDEMTEAVSMEKKNIEIEDFILSKPNTQKILCQEGNCLDDLFPKPRKIAEVLTCAVSATAVQLGFVADSVYDLKSNKKKKLNVLPQIASGCGSPNVILQKRNKKESRLPQMLVKNIEQKENSMISLIEVWKHKKGDMENEKLFTAKAALPSGKLPPLTNKNSFQIAVLPIDLKKRLPKMVMEEFLAGADSNDSYDPYDPFKQAERQMLALLSWPSTADIKTCKNLSASPKSKSSSQQISNLETSPTSAFTKYPNKDDKTAKNEKTNARKNLNETFAINETAKKNSLNEKPTYTAADDWEEIFEKHFDLSRGEITEQMTKSVKSALDGLLKNTIKNKSNLIEDELSPTKSKDEQNSIITEVLYTSTPKRNSKSDKKSKQCSTDFTVDLNDTSNTYRKNSAYDRITPPEDFNDLVKAKKNDKINRNSGISLSSLSFCSQISDTTLADEEVMRSNLEIIGKAAAAAAARTPRRKYARSQSVFDERNKMLFAKTFDPNCSSSEENDIEVFSSVDKQGKKPLPSNPNPKSSPSHFHRSQSVMDGRCKGDGDHSEEGDHVSSPDSNRNRKAKLSGDSAYSSLNRRSPRQNSQRHQQNDRLNSSGSEDSLPTISDYNLKPKSLDFESSPPIKKDQPVKMSKFCHECGSKYPVAVAKFCCECGVRRLVI